MNDRIKRLREKTLSKKPYFSPERALLMTEFYKSGEADRVSVPVARAMAFRYLLERKRIFIDDDELLVGERGPEPKATPSYPEICSHTVQDLEILDTREKISFSVSDETKGRYQETIIPFWNGRSIRDRIFEEVDEEWKDAYNAGIFTEFMEQRAPGHTVLDGKIYRKGLLDFIHEIQEQIDSLDFYSDPSAYDKREELKAMRIAADAVIQYARRHAATAREMAGQIDSNGNRTVKGGNDRISELNAIAEICEKVPANAPETFQEALQYYWFIHLGVITELNTWDSFNPGRLDQHLYPFYKKEIDEGSLTKEQAKELLESFWVKFNNQPAPPKVGVTAEESNTYTDFCLINVGGVKEDGSDGVNELSYLILDVIEEMRILQPSSMVQVSKKNPDRFVKRALEIVKTGFGQPSIFNTDAIIQELTRQGKSIIDARNGGASGCVESGAFGKEAYILTGYFNLPKIVELTLHNGFDPRTAKQLGRKTGNPETWQTFDDFFEAFRRQLHHFIDIKIKGSIVIERLWATLLPAPFLSVLVDDCIKNGKDYNGGGARYNTSYIQGVGLGTITDSLSAIKYHVFDTKTIGMSDLVSVVDANFDEADQIRDILLNETPKYGNDDDRADDLLRKVFNAYYDVIDGRPNSRGGHFRVNLLPTTCHVYFGSVLGATTDGRLKGVPVSEGISPVQGADRNGPTAVVKSASKIDHLRTGGTLLNQKFTPAFLANSQGITKVVHLIRSYFKMDGHHIQFNVISADTLRAAQKEPEKYTDLIVRVAGYSDYFVDLGIDLQNEIIKRTEHITA